MNVGCCKTQNRLQRVVVKVCNYQCLTGSGRIFKCNSRRGDKILAVNVCLVACVRLRNFEKKVTLRIVRGIRDTKREADGRA